MTDGSLRVAQWNRALTRFLRRGGGRRCTPWNRIPTLSRRRHWRAAVRLLEAQHQEVYS